MWWRVSERGIWNGKGELWTNYNRLRHAFPDWSGLKCTAVKSNNELVRGLPSVMYWVYSWCKISYGHDECIFFPLERKVNNDNDVYRLFSLIQNENAFLHPMRKMYILRISDYLLQLIVERQCEKWHNYLVMWSAKKKIKMWWSLTDSFFRLACWEELMERKIFKLRPEMIMWICQCRPGSDSSKSPEVCMTL